MSLSQGPNSPSGVANSNANGGTVSWTNPTNIFAQDGSSATASTGAAATSFRLRASGFGFAIPTDAAIDGFLVEFFKSGSAGIVDAEVLIGPSSILTSDNKADAVTSWPAVAAYVNYGAANDKWNAGLSAADVNGAGFSASVAAVFPGGSANASVDHIRVTVYYTPPGDLPCRQTRAAQVVHPGYFDQ